MYAICNDITHLQTKIIELTKEVDFAVKRRAALEREEECRMEEILSRKLKPKGDSIPKNDSS
jgi:hypothetical protein